MRVYTSRLLEKTPLGPLIAVLRFERPPGLEYRAGQFFNIMFEHDGETLVRPFSIASSPLEEHLEFFVKGYEDGQVAKHLLALPVGSEVQLRGPQGKFVLRDDDRPVYMLAAGSGIAPMMGLLRTIRESARDVILLHGASSSTELGYREELEGLSADEWFTYLPAVSGSEGAWAGLRGRLTEHLEVLENTDADVYVCGPPPMVESTVQRLIMRGFDDQRIFREKYY